jgi:uncharacterized membrane protein
MRRIVRRLLRIFVTGLLAALPLLATVVVLAWTWRLLVGWLGPRSIVGHALSALGLSVTGSEIASYFFGIAILGGAIFALGLLIEANLQRGLQRVVEAVIARIPLVRSIYDLTRRFVEMVAPRDGALADGGLKSMSPVWCHFGGPGGAATLALLSTPRPIELGGAPFLGVLVPSAPVPVGGLLVYVPQAWVTPADIGVEALTSIYMSMGVTSEQQLGGARAATTPPPTGTRPPAR